MRSCVDRVFSLVDALHLDLQPFALLRQKGMAQGGTCCDALTWIFGEHLLEEVSSVGREGFEWFGVEIYLAFAVFLYYLFHLLALEQRPLEEAE